MTYDDAKNHHIKASSHRMDDPVVGHVFGENLQKSLGQKCNTPVWCLRKTLRCLSQKKEKTI